MKTINKTLPIKKRDLGIAGAIVVLAELLSNFQSSQNVATEIVKFREEFAASNLEREQFFVRKSELGNLSIKLDKANDQLTKLNDQVVSLRVFIKSKYGYSAQAKSECVGDESSHKFEHVSFRFGCNRKIQLNSQGDKLWQD